MTTKLLIFGKTQCYLHDDINVLFFFIILLADTLFHSIILMYVTGSNVNVIKLVAISYTLKKKCMARRAQKKNN